MQKEYRIDGMHCASCELLMEKQFKKFEGIERVDADFTRRTVKIEYNGVAPTVAEVNNLIMKYNYCALNEEQLAQITGQKSGSNSTLNDLVLPIALSIVFLLLFLQIEKFSTGISAASSTSAGLLKPFLFGVAASISSCAALVGGLILSLTKDWNNTTGKRKPFPLLQFNAGRLGAFIFFGGVLGTIGGAFQFSIEATAIFIIVVSIFMIFLGTQMLNLFPALNKVQIRMPKAISRKVVSDSASSFAFSPLLVGIGTFFLPCAFTLFTQTDALSSGSFLKGAATMGAFALGTLPVLSFIGLTAKQFTLNSKYSDLFLRTAGFVVLLFALYTINNQLNVLGLPTFTDIFVNN